MHHHRKFQFLPQKRYHLIVKTQEESWQLPQESRASLKHVWYYFEELLFKQNLDYEAELEALVMMRNHFHGILVIKSEDLSLWRSDLSEKLGLKVEIKTIELKCLVQYQAVYRYICFNPLMAGLCRTPLDYPYSSFSILMGHSDLPLRGVMDRMNLLANPTWMITEGPKQLSFDGF